MAQIDIRHIPFALAMLPFLAIGITFSVNMRDWFYGRLSEGEALAFFGGLFIVGVVSGLLFIPA